MNIDYKDWNFDKVGEIEINPLVFDTVVNEDAVAQIVRWQLAKARSGNHATKTRSMVSGTNKKPWAQKETGKSRQGSLRSPHFRGGGVVFGPHPRSYDFKINKKLRKIAACSMLTDKIRAERIHVLNNFNMPFNKTKDFVKWKSDSKLGSILFVVGNELESDNIQKVFSNVAYCNILPVRGFNVYDGIKHDSIIFDVNSIFQLQDRYVIANAVETNENESEESL